MRLSQVGNATASTWHLRRPAARRGATWRREFVDGMDARAAGLLLLRDRIGALPGGEGAAAWSVEQTDELVQLVAAHKDDVEPADVCLLGDVKRRFKAAGVGTLRAREKAVAAIQEHLWPKPIPKAEDPTALSKDFLRAAQQGLLLEARQLLTARPSLLGARSTSKGYTAMHYAAMGGALPVLDWLADLGLDPEAPSEPPADAGEQPVTPTQVAMEYGRGSAAARLTTLAEGRAFVRAHAASDIDAALAAAASSGSAAGARALLRREPAAATRPCVGSALLAAARGGHVEVLALLAARGALLADPTDVSAPTLLATAVAANQARAANWLSAYARAADLVGAGHWTDLRPEGSDSGAPSELPPLLGLAADAKLSRGRCTVMDLWEPLLASPSGSPGMEAAYFRWIETELRLPIWLPVDATLYAQFGPAVRNALDSFGCASQRDALLHLADSNADALHRLCSVLPYAQVPHDLGKRTADGLSEVVGDENFSTHWERLAPSMRDWLGRALYFFPIAPWGRTPASAPTGLELELVMIEMLTKARLLYALMEPTISGSNGSADGGKPRRLTNSALPFQPDHPETCPYGESSRPPADVCDARAYAAVLFLRVPVDPALVAERFPQLLQLNGGGIGGELREKVASRVALRLLLNGLEGANPRWVLIPSVYVDHLALAALARLGGPAHVCLRQPNALRAIATQDGELVLYADDLDDVLRVLLRDDGARDAPKRIHAILAAAGWAATDGSGGSGVLLLEEMVPGAALPQDGKKGWYDPTQRAYFVHTPAASAESAVLGGACRFPARALCAAPGASAHAQHAPGAAHGATALGPQMAGGAFTGRLRAAELCSAVGVTPLRELLTACLRSESAHLHLAALSVLSTATAGARRVHPDPAAINYAHFEYFGQPFAPNASLWPEHKPLLAALATDAYTSRHPKPLAALVHRRLLLDVVAKDLIAVASNALRAPDADVVAMLAALESSPFSEVREMAREVRGSLAEMHASGKQSADFDLASAEHMAELVDMLEHRCRAA